MQPKKLGQETTVFQSDRLTVKSAELTLADNTKVKWEYPVVQSSVVVVPVNSRHQVVLVKEWRLPYKKELLSLPGGKCESFDQRLLVNQAQKELQQEIGFSSGHLILLGQTYASAGIHKIDHIFLATQLKKINPQPESGELIRVVTMPIKQAYHHFRKQEPSTAYSTVGLVWAMEALELLSV